MRTIFAALLVASLSSILMVAVAEAASTEVYVRIEGKSETLFEGPVWTEGHDVRASSDTQQRSCDGVNVNDPENVMPGPTPTASSVDAMSIIGETFDGDWYNSYDDYFITRWGPDEQDAKTGAYWGIVVDNVFTDVGGCQYELAPDDEVLWAYDAFASRAFLSLLPVAAHYTSGPRPLTATAELGKPFEVEVLDYADQKEDKPPTSPERAGSIPYGAGADVSPVRTNAEGFEKVETESPETAHTNAEGRTSITFSSPGWHRLKASAFNEEGEEAIRSNRLDVCVPAQGATGCGEPPAEDRPRTPPAQAHTESTETGSVSGTSASGSSTSPSAGPSASPPVSTSPPAPFLRARPVLLTLQSISAKRLLLNLTAPGRATVRVARRMGNSRHPDWRAVKPIAVKVSKAGEVEVRLPRLRPGRYRVSISLAGATGVTRLLTVSRGRG